MSSPIILIFAGAVMLALGVLTIIYRRKVASGNAKLLNTLGGKAGERESRRSTPVQFLLAGLVGTVGGLLALLRGIQLAIFGG